MIKIVELDEKLLKGASELVFKIFPSMSMVERLSFWAYKHREKCPVKMLMRLSGIFSLIKYCAAVNENGDVCGTTGLYQYTKDRNDAVWLAWFCVHPDQRGRGTGKQLIEYSINEARKLKKKYFRLYTSTDPNEAAAQILYEKYGFMEKSRKKTLSHTKIFRELEL